MARESWQGDTGLTIEFGLAHANNDDGHGQFGSLGEDRGGEKTYVRDRQGREGGPKEERARSGEG